MGITRSRKDSLERPQELSPEEECCLVERTAEEQECLAFTLNVIARLCCDMMSLYPKIYTNIFNPAAWCECVLMKCMKTHVVRIRGSL